MVRCEKCRFHYHLRNESWCDYINDYVREDSSCEHGEFPEDYSEPQTNADRIRAMTDEELAEFLDLVRGSKTYPIYYTDWIEWLKQEANE